MITAVALPGYIQRDQFITVILIADFTYFTHYDLRDFRVNSKAFGEHENPGNFIKPME